MQVIVSSSTFLKNLNIVNGIIGTSTVLPILEDFLLDIKNQELTIIGSDLETRIQVSLPIQIAENSTESSVAICIPSKILIEYLKNLPEQPIHLTINPEQQSLEITSNTGKYKITGQSAQEYPKAPDTTDAQKFQVPGVKLIESINSTIFATSSDTLRPAMTGVCFNFINGQLIMVATDAHRLVKKELYNINIPTDGSIIVPKKPLNLFKNIIPNDETSIDLSYSTSHLYVQYESVKLSARLIDARFPDYNAVIPQNNPYKLVIDRVEIISALRRVSVFASKGTSQVVFDISGNVIHISAQDADFSYEGNETIPCQYDGEDMKIAFNARLLIEMLNNLDSDQVEVALNTPSKAAVFTNTDIVEDEQLLMLLMPLVVSI